MKTVRWWLYGRSLRLKFERLRRERLARDARRDPLPWWHGPLHALERFLEAMKPDA